MNGVQAGDVREHLARVTASSLFAGTERLRRFLAFTVESVLAGRAETLKEYVVGREVFDRDEQYDTRLDPIVRVEARRLRARLLEYYSGPGRNEPIRLEYPKGQYVPIIRKAGSLQPPARQGNQSRLPSLYAAVALAVALVGLYVVTQVRPPAPSIAPIPASWIQSSATGADRIDVDLAEAIDAELARNRSLSVLAWPEIQQRFTRSGDLATVATRLGVSELLYVLVRKVDYANRINIFLIAEPSGRKRLAFTYDVLALATPHHLARLARQIANDFARTAQ